MNEEKKLKQSIGQVATEIKEGLKQIVSDFPNGLTTVTVDVVENEEIYGISFNGNNPDECDWYQLPSFEKAVELSNRINKLK